MFGGHRQVLCEAEVDKLDLRCVLINHDVLGLQVPEDYLKLVQIVEEDERLGSKELDLLQSDADLLTLELEQSYPLDWLHEEVDMHVALEGGVELRETRGRQVLLSPLLQATQDVSLINQVLNLLLLVQLLQLNHLESIHVLRGCQGQDALHTPSALVVLPSEVRERAL